jgi:hypothetical protein
VIHLLMTCDSTAEDRPDLRGDRCLAFLPLRPDCSVSRLLRAQLQHPPTLPPIPGVLP